MNIQRKISINLIRLSTIFVTAYTILMKVGLEIYNMKLIYKTVTNVAGMNYRKEKVEKAFGLMQSDETNNVKLVREPSNPYDHLAIKVYLEGIFIGYIPKKGMKHLRKLIQETNIIIKAKATLMYFDINKDQDCVIFIEVWEI